VCSGRDAHDAEGRFGRTRESLRAISDECKPGLVSIIIPCFNMERFVGEAIESCLGQTYQQVEVIVIDDGSTDDSLRVIREYESRITYRSRPNAGACVARNDGIELSKGEFIQFLDADDTLMPDAIERRLAVFDDGVGLVFGERIHTSDDGSPRIWHKPPHTERGWEDIGMVRYVLFGGLHTLEPLHRRFWACEVGGFDESLPKSQEPDFHLRLLLAGCEFSFLPGVVGMQRHHSSETRIANTRWWESDSEHAIATWRHRIELIGAHDASIIDEGLQRDIARRLTSEAVHVARHGEIDLARRYHDEILRVCPGYRPSGMAGLATRVFGLWVAIRVGAWRIQLRNAVHAMTGSGGSAT